MPRAEVTTKPEVKRVAELATKLMASGLSQREFGEYSSLMRTVSPQEVDAYIKQQQPTPAPRQSAPDLQQERQETQRLKQEAEELRQENIRQARITLILQRVRFQGKVLKDCVANE